MCRAKRGPQWKRPKLHRGIVFNDVINIHKNLSIKSYIFPKGLTHDFNSKFSLFVFGENTTTSSAS